MRYRISVFALLVLLGSVLPFPRYGQSRDLKEVFIASSTVGAGNISTFYARDRKFFEQEGLDVKITVVRSTLARVALVAGSVGYNTFAPGTIQEALKGLPLRVIAVTGKKPVWGLVVRKGIGKVQELKGKTLGVLSLGGMNHYATIYILRHHGLDPKRDVTIRPIGGYALGGYAPGIAALHRGFIDGMIFASPGDLELEKEGFKILLDVGIVFNFPMSGLSTTVKKIQENPTEVKKVVRAVLRATRSMVDPKHKDEVVRFMTSAYKVDAKMAEDAYRRIIPALSPTGMVGADRIKLVIDSAIERGVADKPRDPSSVVDFSFAKEIAEELR